MREIFLAFLIFLALSGCDKVSYEVGKGVDLIKQSGPAQVVYNSYAIATRIPVPDQAHNCIRDSAKNIEDLRKQIPPEQVTNPRLLEDMISDIAFQKCMSDHGYQFNKAWKKASNSYCQKLVNNPADPVGVMVCEEDLRKADLVRSQSPSGIPFWIPL